jgi:hypothetical protein
MVHKQQHVKPSSEVKANPNTESEEYLDLEELLRKIDERFQAIEETLARHGMHIKT